MGTRCIGSLWLRARPTGDNNQNTEGAGDAEKRIFYLCAYFELLRKEKLLGP
jgi:hypothetical protein